MDGLEQSQRRTWFYLLVIAGLGLLFFADLVLHPTQILYSDYSDFISLHLPAKRFLVRSWQETGEVPLWCPYSFSGMPFVHDMQSSAFYPPHWPLYFLPEELVGAALSWLIVLHVIAAGFCMFAYARSQDLGGVASLVAAIGYMFAGKWLLHLLAGGHYNMVPLAWLPLVLLFLEQAIRRRSLLRATWAGCAFSLVILGAYPYVTLYAGLFIALWTFGTALEEAGYLGGGGVHSRRRTLGAIGRWLALGAWTALVGVALGAVQLLPGLEAAGQASRSLGVDSYRDMLLGGLHSIVNLVGPPLAGNPDEIWENRIGLGLLWLGLAALAPLLAGPRPGYQAGICLALFFFPLGGFLAVQWLPGFHFFQLPSRILLLLSFPIGLMAGETLETLAADPGPAPALRGRCRQVFAKIIGLVIVLMIVLTAVSKGQKGFDRHPYWFTLALTVPIAFWLLGGHPSRAGRWQLAWLLLLLVDGWSIALPLVAVRQEEVIYAPSASVEYLIAHRQEHGRVLDFNPNGHPANSTPLWPGLPLVVQVEPVRGFNPIDVLIYKEYLQFITDQDEPLRPLDRMFTSALLGTLPIRNPSLVNLLGIRYRLQPSSWRVSLETEEKGFAPWQKVGEAEDSAPVAFNFIPPERPETVAAPSPPLGYPHAGFQPLPPYSVYENRQVFPRAFIVPEAARLPGRTQVLAALRVADFRRHVLLADYTPRSDDPAPTGEFRPAIIQVYQPNRVVIEASGDAPGYLVLTDVWYPGWAGTVDGHPARLYRANYLFRAVPVTAGTHEVVFTFAPDSYRLGKIISNWTALVVIIFSFLAIIWPRRLLLGNAGQGRDP